MGHKITRREAIRQFAGAIALTSGAVGCSTDLSRNQPNIVLILADDLGWRQLGCYGTDYYETPNIDHLARQGMRFSNAYATCPVCSPTRASLMTGKYPARLHLTDFIPGGNPPPNSPLEHPDWKKYLPLDQMTVAEALQNIGYATASYGKWHLSKAKTPPESLSHDPDKQGFDDSYVTYKPVPTMARAWQDSEEDPHNVGFITEKAIDFIRLHKEQPFFLLVSHNSIHTPLKEKQALIEKYRDKAGSERSENNPVIAAMLERFDGSVGKIMQTLQDLGLEENTLLVFYSDNGGLDRRNEEIIALQTPLRAGKGDLYEGGIRVPLIVRWPGKVPAGNISDEIVSTVDFFPTFLEAAGNSNTHETHDGKSLIPIFNGSGKLDREAIYWHYPHYHSAGSGPAGAIRSGRYKLIEWYEGTVAGVGKEVELFDLENDIGEQQDLAPHMPEKANDLKRQLADWRRSVGAQMPSDNPQFVGGKNG